MSLIPYYLRSLRLYVIFKAQEFYFREKRKPHRWFKYIKEAALIKITLLFILLLGLITAALYLGYAIGGKGTKESVYTPSYNVDACYIDDTEVDKYLEAHINASLTYIIVFHFLECMGLLYSIHKLTNIKEDFSIRKEL